VKVIHTSNRAPVERLMKDAQARVIRAGWFASAQYRFGTPVPVAAVAAVHEFGSPKSGIPARPFFRMTIAERENEWRNLLHHQMTLVLAGNLDLHQAYAGFGAQVVADVKTTIVDGSFQPLSQETLQRRKTRKNPPPTGGEAILRDTTTLLSTLTCVVENR
jgi:hypothetical protein